MLRKRRMRAGDSGPVRLPRATEPAACRLAQQLKMDQTGYGRVVVASNSTSATATYLQCTLITKRSFAKHLFVVPLQRRNAAPTRVFGKTIAKVIWPSTSATPRRGAGGVTQTA